MEDKWQRASALAIGRRRSGPVVLVACLLKPLGYPPANSVKFFATLELLELVKDRAWLAKMTNALTQHWQKKNTAKQNQPSYNQGCAD